MRQRLLRPRVLAYTAVLALLPVAMAASLALRVPLKVDVIRDCGSMGREVDAGWVENVYRLQLMNTSESPRRLRLRVDGLPGAVNVERAVVTRRQHARDAGSGAYSARTGRPGSNRIEFAITALDDAAVTVREEAALIVPR